VRKSGRLQYAIVGAVAIAGLLVLMNAPALTSSSFLHGRMLSVHLVLELFAIMIAALVVTVSWHTFDRRDCRAAHALIAGFMVVAFSDLLHALTYEGMPNLLSESSTPRAIFFWLMGRTFEVGTLAVIALNIVPKVSRYASLAFGVVMSLAVIGVGSLAVDSFPRTFVAGIGVTPFKAHYEYVLCGLNMLLALMLRRRAIKEGAPQFMMLALSSFVMGIGELAFTAYVTPSDFQNIVGHLYKVLAYALLYRATFIKSIRAPYEALRASEAEVRENQVRLLTLGANLPNTVIYQLVQDLDGVKRFTQVGDASERVNGLKALDVMRDPMLLYGQVHPDDMPLLVAAERRSAETMQVFDVEVRMRRADGSMRRMHLVSAPRRLEAGRIAWDGIETDVTERSEAEGARRVLEAQLREAQKMESIGTLASGIAHDFNNVLGSILGNAAMAREDAQRCDQAELLRGLDQISKAAQRARDLVRQILTFSRRQAPDLLAQPMRPIVDESIALLRATLPANVHVAVRVDEPRVQARVDRTQVSQVILNLCTNAWHAMGDGGGLIEVGLDAVSMEGGAAIAAGLMPGAYARLWVEDNGCGMDEATCRRVFEPFFTTKPVGRGTGLGLSVVHGIMKSHDGAVALASSPGFGTRFDAYFPMLAGQELVDPAGRGAPDGILSVGHGERVLYLDDDEVMSIMVERLLQRSGYEVTCLRDPMKAIQRLSRNPEAFDVLVTDYNMPTLSGLDVVRELAGIRPGLPTVLMSGFVTEELHTTAQDLGVFDVLEKQNALEALAPSIEGALARTAKGRKTAPLRVVC
jgi:signal transduction histidine kinase/ActR/RegA family two-component response regulator